MTIRASNLDLYINIIPKTVHITRAKFQADTMSDQNTQQQQQKGTLLLCSRNKGTCITLTTTYLRHESFKRANKIAGFFGTAAGGLSNTLGTATNTVSKGVTGVTDATGNVVAAGGKGLGDAVTGLTKGVGDTTKGTYHEGEAG
jgi:hypothetical protein